MKIPFIIQLFSLMILSFNSLSSQCSRLNDSLVLVEIFNSNPQSQGFLGWDIAGSPVDTWNGITIDGGGCVTRIEITDAGLAILPESIGTLSRLNFIDLKRNSLAALPDGIGNLARLTVLELAENSITQIPESIRGLIMTIRIDLTGNNLVDLPEAMGSLPRLRFLYLDRNSLSELPESIGDLSRLEELELNLNELVELPGSIGNLVELTHLRLAENRIASIPASIGDLERLTVLDLQSNFISEIPATIGKLSNLTSLEISGNQISQLPESIGNLSKLEVLNAYRNDLSEFPESIGLLSALKVLNFGGNNIIRIPDNIGDLSRLKELYLHNNNLFDIPATIGDLVLLERLWLNSNYLTELPESIGQLTTLDFLYIYNNSLLELPGSIGNLTTLNYLFLHNNKLTELPESFGNMENLQYLRLENNDLQKLPSTVGGLESLIQFDLRNNNIKDLPAPLGQLTDIKELDVVDNALSFEDLNNVKNFIDRPDIMVSYTPQNIFTRDTIFYFKKGIRGAIDLGYDAGLNDSEYSWFKDEEIYSPGPGNDIRSNQLVFEDPDLSDIGVYRAVSINPDFPGLTVQSANISVKVCDRRSDSLELVRLYFATNGSQWRNKTNWLVPGMPIGTWSGVTLDASSCISKLDLAGNMLTGGLPDLQMNTLDTLILADNELSGVISNNTFVPYIRYVDLSGNDLAGSIPEVIGGWMQIENLILANNSMGGSIPPDIGDLCELTELQLEGNNFGGEVPTELTMLNNLKKGAVSFANNMLDSIRQELIYFCPFGVEIMANNPGGFEKFVEICGDTCGGFEFDQLTDIPWLVDTIQGLDCTGAACFDNNVRSDAGMVVVRGLKIIFTRTRCYTGQETFDETTRLYDCGGNILENIICDADRACSGLGVITAEEFENLDFEIKWSCGCDFTKCIANDTIFIDEGQSDTLMVGDFVDVSEVCNPGFYSITSVNNELPGTPPVVTEVNIGFAYELAIENLVSGQQCTTRIEVFRGLTGSNDHATQKSNGTALIACHPNPVVDFLRCPEVDMATVKEYRVFNIQGMEMPKYVENYKDKLQLNVQQYPAGMYILLVKTEDRQYLNRFTVMR